MPKGEDFSIELKMILFRLIDFVEQEGNGVTIPLHRTTVRLMKMLGIEETSIGRLKKELAEQRQEQKKYSKRPSIILGPERNLLQFPVDLIGSGVGHLLRSQIPFLLFHFRYRHAKQEIRAVRHLCSPKWLRIRFDTTFT